MCVFFLFLLVFFWKVTKEGTLVWCIIRSYVRRWFFRCYARRLILEICFPIYFWSSGEVVGWDLKMPSKNWAEPRRECLCEPGSSPEEPPRRNRYFSPSRLRLGSGTKCTVWSCLLLLVRHRQRPTRIVSALVSEKYRCFPTTAICYFVRLEFACFLSSIGFQQKKSVYGQCLSSKGMKRSESLNSLYTTWISDFHLAAELFSADDYYLGNSQAFPLSWLGFSWPFTDRIFPGLKDLKHF